MKCFIALLIFSVQLTILDASATAIAQVPLHGYVKHHRLLSVSATNLSFGSLMTANLSSAAPTYTIMNPSSTPALIDSNDSNPVEVGVKFRADSSGYVTGLRFYKASTNVGMHVGHIWSSSGALLGSATFTSETGSGWQQVAFAAPIPVSANTTYIASYFAPSGHYSQNENSLAPAGIDNPPLHALSNGVDGPDGVYLYSSTSGFPTSSYQSTNYWVDIVYTPAQSTQTHSISGTITGTGGTGVTVMLSGAINATTTSDGSGNYIFSGLANGSYTITPTKAGFTFTPASQSVTVQGANVTANFPSAAPGYTIMNPSSTPALIDSNDFTPVELGVKFRADANGYVTGLRFYKASTNIGTHVGHIWSNSGTLLGSAKFTSETGSGWQQVSFSTPIPVSANTTYIASYFAPSGHYSANTNAFATAGIDNPPLHALANGVDGSDGVYLYSSSGGFPTNSYKSTNYWVDIVYTAAQSPVANPQLTESATNLSFGSVAVNSSTTQSLTLRSTGTSPVTVNSASTTGAGFTIVAGSFPITLNPTQALTLQVKFMPTATGTATGQITISSNSTSGSTAVVALSGTGTVANPQLTESATNLSFGSVTVNSSTTQSLTLKSTGTSSVTVNSASIASAGFTIVGGSFPVTLNPTQSLTLQVKFMPTATGTATGQLTISSNSTSGSTAVVALSGIGTAVAHKVDLTWNAPSSSPDPVAGYNIYRSTGNGSYQLMNSSLDAQTAYVDSTALGGATYNYMVKSVDYNGIESSPSNQITATIP